MEINSTIGKINAYQSVHHKQNIMMKKIVVKNAQKDNILTIIKNALIVILVAKAVMEMNLISVFLAGKLEEVIMIILLCLAYAVVKLNM